MHNTTTDRLDDILMELKPEQYEQFIRQNKDKMLTEDRPFTHFFDDALKRAGISKKDFFIQLDWSESYGGKILRMEKHVAKRDKIIKMCLAAHLSRNDADKALKMYGFRDLYSKDPRDVRIIMAIQGRRYDIYDLDRDLEAHGFKKLS